MRRSKTAWVIWAVCVAASLSGILMSAASDAKAEGGWVITVAFPLAFLAFPTVGAIVSARVHGNKLGMIFLGAGLVFSIGALADTYGRFEPGPLAGATIAAWIVHWTIQSPAIYTFFTFFLLLFPTGRPPTPRWRWLARFSLAVTAVFVFLVAFKPGELAESGGKINPFEIAALGPLWKVVEMPLFFGLLLSVVAAAGSFVLRFRRSRGVERQQLKWFAAAGVLLACVMGSAPVIFSTPAIWWLWGPLFLIGTTSIPVAAGLAITRYRLYDIDRIISRTVSYAVLTVLTVAMFAGIVVGPGLVLGSGGTVPDYVIAAATLVVAALFRPMLHRVQRVVDKRFNRARYNASATVESFSARLRQQIDLDAIGSELTAVVGTTVHPEHVSLWIRT
jgi:hypothetical protein